MASRTKNSVTNIAMNLTNQIVALVLGFVSRTVFIHTLGVEYLGINSLFTDVLSMLSMADLGFNTAMVYSLYQPIAENDQRKIAALIGFYRRVYRVIAIGITVIGLALTPFIRFIVQTEEDIPLLEVYYLFSLASVVISYLFVYQTSIITADQKNYIVTRFTIFTTILRTVIQIILLWLVPSFILYLAIGVLFNFLNNFIASRKAVKLYPYISEKVPLEKREISQIFRNLKSVFIYKLSSVMLNATDNVLISVLVSTTMVGYYSNYLMVNNKITSIISLIFTSLTASIGNIIVKESAKKRYEIFQIEQSISNMITGTIVPCFFILINDLIRVWLGEGFVISTALAAVMAVNLYLSCVLQPLWSYREATGMYQKTKWVMLIAAGINVIFSIILGYFWGIVGILAASAIARIGTYVWYEPKLLFREYFGISCKVYFKEITVNAVLILILSALLYIGFAFFTVTSWWMLLLKSIVCAGICLGIMVLCYRKSEGFRILWERVKNIWTRICAK